MSKRRNLDGVASLQGFLAKAGDEFDTTPSSQAKSQAKKKTAFDPRAEDSESESEAASGSDSDSDSDGALPDPTSWNRLNKSTSTPTSQKGITPSKRTARSNGEEVADSDDGRDAKNSKNKNKKKAAKKAASSSSDSSVSSDSSESEGGVPVKKTAKKSASKKNDDTSSNDASSSAASGSDSDSDDDSDDDAGSKKAAKSLMNGKRVPAKETASTSSSSASSTSVSSESEAEAPAKKGKKGKKAALKKVAPKEATPEESSGSEEESEEEESTSAVETEKEPEKVVEPLAVVPPPKKTITNGFQGENFLLRPVQGDEDGKDVQDFFAQAKREGKQLWYFTAPASVPINVIEQLEIPIHKIRNGEPVFKHDGADYGVNVSNEAANPTYQVLIPNKKGVRYEPVAQNIEQVMRIKRIIQVPSPADGDITPLPLASSRGPRPQPKGLKARYHPIGVAADEDMGKLGSESDDDAEDVEMTQAPALPSSSQKSSKKASTTTKKAKRKAAEVDEEAASSQLIGEEEAALKKKKTKKQKRSAEDTPACTPAVASQELQTPILPVLPAPKSSKKAKKVSFPAPASSQSSKKETPILPPVVPHRASSSAPTPAPSAKKEKKSKTSSTTPKSKSRHVRPLSP